MHILKNKYTLMMCAVALCGVLYTGCTAVKPHQAHHLKEHHMQLNALTVEKSEAEADTYREGVSGGMGGKTGGGCGCN